MSEPMSSGEIEDVLSSIRKLVSEDLRPVTPRSKSSLSGPEATVRSAPAVPLEADKLLLTPALRVVEVRPAGPEEPAPHEVGGPGDPAQGDTLAGQVAAADENPEPLSLDRTLRLDLGDAQRDVFDPIGEDPAAGPERDEDPAPFAEDFAFASPGGESGIGAALTSIGSAVDQNRDDWESETGDGGFVSLAWKAPQWVEEAEILGPVTAPLSGHDPERLSPEAAEAAALAEIEAAERAAWGDAARYDTEPAPSPVPPPATSPDEGSEPEADLLAEDDPVYDEDLLRDLVRDIIREELSGTLGERITRNVRKLVRAEIARAMTVREFD